MTKRQQPLSLLAALSPLLVMLLCLALGAWSWGFSPDLIIISMLAAATVAGAMTVWQGYSWLDLQAVTAEKLAAVLPAILILLMIGMLIGTWVFSGTIPLMIYYGIKLIQPEYMIVSAFFATAIMSLFTGTSWGSAGTLGVALVGASSALAVPVEMTAGAVVSGAYFGDKLSPLSDTTNICAIGAKADLYRHIYHMLYTALPSFVIAALVYWLLGGAATAEEISPSAQQQLIAEIQQIYSFSAFSVVLLLPLVIIFLGVSYRYPAVLVMAAASLLAMLLGVVVNGFSVHDAFVAAVAGFNVELVTSIGLQSSVFSDEVNKLLNRGGIYSMTNTLVIIICAFLLAAGLQLSGALDKIISSLVMRAHSVFGMVASSMLAGTTMISLTNHGSVTALLVGNLYQEPYRKLNLAPENLSRSLEDSVTIVEPLLPWTVSAVFMASTLGVATIEYMPWALFCYGGPIFSLLYAATFSKTRFGLKTIRSG